MIQPSRSKPPFLFAALICLTAMAACSSDDTLPSGSGGGAGETASGGGGQGGSGGGEVDAQCMALCAHPAYQCTGPDLESGSGSTSAVTATGCTVSVMLATSGNLELELDCLAGQACVTSGDAGCAGKAGECYPTDFDTTSFSYLLPNCANGSLSCSQIAP